MYLLLKTLGILTKKCKVIMEKGSLEAAATKS